MRCLPIISPEVGRHSIELINPEERLLPILWIGGEALISGKTGPSSTLLLVTPLKMR
jgi:hypothetical protein